MNKVEALHAFWNSFGVQAYDEHSVPPAAEYPYITYNVATDTLGGVVSLHADLWFYDTLWKGITDLTTEISRRIKEYTYLTIPFDGGYIYLTGGTPFAQRIDDPDENIKRVYINVQAEYLCKY